MSTVLFLSDGWLAAVDEALATLTPAVVEHPVRIEYRVSGGPEGDQAHQITLGPDRIRAHRPAGRDLPEHGPTVTLSLEWELALAINRGTVSAQSAFLDGRIRLAGDPSALLARQGQLSEIDDVLASVRVRTRSE